MYHCKIKVLETTVQSAFAEKFHLPAPTPCPLYQPGKQWILTYYGRPLDLCEDAWTAIHRTVYGVLSGAGASIGGHWLEDGKRAVVCCNEGLRPVLFEVSRTDELP